MLVGSIVEAMVIKESYLDGILKSKGSDADVDGAYIDDAAAMLLANIDSYDDGNNADRYAQC